MQIKNRNNFIFWSMVTFIFVLSAVLICVIFVIWFSNESTPSVGIYSYKGFENTVVKDYQLQLQNLLKESNARKLVELLNEDYLENLNLSKENPEKVIEYLKSQFLLSTNPKINSYTVSSNLSTGVYVYKFTYYSNSFEKKVYLIETEPYVYTLSFDQNYSATNAKKKALKVQDNVKIEITLIESTDNSLKYNAKITNNNDDDIKLDFNDVSNVDMYFSDGAKIKLATVVTLPDEYFNLTKNSYLNQELFFNVPLERQGEIVSIVFSNIVIGNETKTIEVSF